MANHIDAIAADFSTIPFPDHEARRLAFAYLDLRGLVQRIADGYYADPVSAARETLDRLLASQPQTTYSRPAVPKGG